MDTSPERGWNYNIIDFTGAIYLPYGTVKIPTYILIDENNVVIARKSTLEDIEKFMKL